MVIRQIIFRWFTNNQMITNPHKWYLITSFNKELSIFVKKNNIKQRKSPEKGVKYDEN